MTMIAAIQNVQEVFAQAWSDESLKTKLLKNFRRNVMQNKLTLVLSSIILSFTSTVVPATAYAIPENSSRQNESIKSKTQAEPNMGNLSKAGMNGELMAQAWTSDWTCYQNHEFAGFVTIWWGHTSKDAAWACNQSKETRCGGNCWAAERYRKSAPPERPLGACNVRSAFPRYCPI